MSNKLICPTVHFIGIGGVGMNALAQLSKLFGFKVSGSDRGFNPNLSPYKELLNKNIAITPQDGSNISNNIDYVVYSSAIENDNLDLKKCKKLQLKCLHRSEFLKFLIPNDAELIAVTGTAGKTTTTGLIGWIFEYAKLNPTVYNGASVLNWKNSNNLGNIRYGNKKLWIIEADESDKSMLKFNPTHAILTNIGKDHLPLKSLKKIFKKFEEQTAKIFQKTTFNADRVDEIKNNLIGKHNYENIKIAYEFCINYGIDDKLIRNAIKKFSGIERRLEFVGTFNHIKLYDDYAHNSMKICATINSFQHNKKNVHAFWRPHGHASFNNNYNDLINIFSNFLKNNKGSIILLPIYYVGGTVCINRTSEDMYDELNKLYKNFYYAPNYQELKKIIIKICSKDDVLIGMGARDPNISSFIKNLKENEL